MFVPQNREGDYGFIYRVLDVENEGCANDDEQDDEVVDLEGMYSYCIRARVAMVMCCRGEEASGGGSFPGRVKKGCGQSRGWSH